MDKIIIPGSITLEKSIATQIHKWKSNKKKQSIYKRPVKRAFVRLSCNNFSHKAGLLKKEDRQIKIIFINNSNILIKRTKGKNISLQGYSGKHPYLQFVINRLLPKDIWKLFEESNKKTLTIPVNVTLNLDEWSDLKILPEDFIIEVEKEAKSLMNKALGSGFSVNYISKGRDFDLKLNNPKNKEIIIAISSHSAKNKSRTKEKTIQKILMDIAKLLPYLYENKDSIPVVITKPIEFENSWSYSTKRYLDFYKKKFNFIFLTTEFKNGWEDNII